MRIRSHIFKRVVPISMLLLAVLFKFQNCAGPEAGMIASDTGGSGEVRIIDRWQQQKVAFLSDTQFVVNPEDAVIQGLCVGGTTAEQISYEIIHTAGAEPSIQSAGTVDCRMGNFEIAVPDLQFSDCEDSYTVRAIRVSGDGGEAYTNVRPYCDEG
jgi:hypothetical protein